jgi:hypothetical protein
VASSSPRSGRGGGRHRWSTGGAQDSQGRVTPIMRQWSALTWCIRGRTKTATQLGLGSNMCQYCSTCVTNAPRQYERWSQRKLWG